MDTVTRVGDKWRLSDELQQAYPRAATAITFVEVSGVKEGDRWWGALIGVVEKQGIDRLLQVLSSTTVPEDELPSAQFYTSDFRKYIMARLGMM